MYSVGIIFFFFYEFNLSPEDKKEELNPMMEPIYMLKFALYDNYIIRKIKFSHIFKKQKWLLETNIIKLVAIKKKN